LGCAAPLKTSRARRWPGRCARAERGAEPSAGLLPTALDERFPRDEADARIAIVARRIAGAKAAHAAARARGAA